VLCKAQAKHYLSVAKSVPPESSLPEVRYNSHYANDDKVDTNQIIQYLGENHNNNAENKACYPHP
jgi:hypothetical protein